MDAKVHQQHQLVSSSNRAQPMARKQLALGTLVALVAIYWPPVTR